MNFLSRTNEQELDLENAKSYIHELQLLEIFTKNVPLNNQHYISKASIFIEVAKQLKKSFSIHKAKVLPLWMHLIERANIQQLGITTVHLTLLQILKTQNHFKLALKIVEHPGLPIFISTVKYQQYLILCAQIYNQFQRYVDAVDMLVLVNSIESQNFEVSFMALKMLILTLRILGRRFDRFQLEKDVGKMKLNCQKHLQEIQFSNPQKAQQIMFEYDIFMRICDETQLQQKELQYLRLKQLLDLYQKAPTRQINVLKHMIKNQIANQTLYRVKQQSLNQVSLHKFEIVRDINKLRAVYRSDARNKIMYFVHQHSNQAKLDSMINQACILQRIIKNRPPIESRNERDDGDEDRFGRIGMGGFGGMAGFGSLGGKLGGLMGFGRN